MPDHSIRYVFVCGMHRSGTSVLARNLAKLPDCSGFTDTGVVEDEGQYLQNVYPADVTYGGTGRYGFDERAHLTEKSALLTSANIQRLRSSWNEHWNADSSIRIEKTPGNLIMTRFLQAVFPNAYFVIITRHPIAVSMATQRWTVTRSALHRLFDHWLRCHEIFEEDKQYLRHVYELSYEEYIKAPIRYHQEIAGFLGVNVTGQVMEEVTTSHNKRYFDRWLRLLTKSPFRQYYEYLASSYESRFLPYGYSLVAPVPGENIPLLREDNTPRWLGLIYFKTAELNAFAARTASRGKGRTKKAIRRIIPERLKVKIRQLGAKVA